MSVEQRLVMASNFGATRNVMKPCCDLPETRETDTDGALGTPKPDTRLPRLYGTPRLEVCMQFHVKSIRASTR